MFCNKLKIPHQRVVNERATLLCTCPINTIILLSVVAILNCFFFLVQIRFVFSIDLLKSHI